MSIDDAIHAAVEHHRAGRLAEAETFYRTVLSQQPAHFEALHLLGALFIQVRQPKVAIDLIKRALLVNAQHAEAHSNLGNALQAVGRSEEALAACREAIRLNPSLAEAHCNLGNALRAVGRSEEAAGAFRESIRLQPALAEAHNSLGMTLQAMGRYEEAVATCRHALRLRPAFADAYNNLGSALLSHGDTAGAIAACQEAIRIDPNLAEAYDNLGNALQAKGCFVDAISAHRQALLLQPIFAKAHTNLAIALRSVGQFSEAIAACHEALRFDPFSTEAHTVLIAVLEACGRTAEAIVVTRALLRLHPALPKAHEIHAALSLAAEEIDEAVFAARRAVELEPGFARAYATLGRALLSAGRARESLASHAEAVVLAPDHPDFLSHRLFALHFDPGTDAAALLQAHGEWNERHARPLRPFIRAHRNDPSPDRPLRIGYVSTDFSEHVVARCLLPLLREHDPERFQAFCYSNSARTDTLTERIRTHARGFRNIVGVPDTEAAEIIENDGIDVLVDLALHTNRNRLALFARKPAPVQATYLGYGSTTGLDSIDFRLSDPFLDPPNSDLSCYSEKTIRLPRSYWCYEVARAVPEIAPLPARAAGFLTFGSLNNFAKVSTPTLDLWAEILQALPRSKLLLNVPPGSCREAVLARFARQNVSPERVEFVAQQSWDGYIQTWQHTDIALDPFPFGGGITTCDALWMGVPVVTLSGRTAVGRGGRSILSNIGLPELIAETPKQYVKIAVALANDLPRLSELRFTLRDLVERSPLRDPVRHAREVETAYREMWRTWCESKVPPV